MQSSSLITRNQNKIFEAACLTLSSKKVRGGAVDATKEIDITASAIQVTDTYRRHSRSPADLEVGAQAVPEVRAWEGDIERQLLRAPVTRLLPAHRDDLP